MLDSELMTIKNLGMNGFSAKCIQKALRGAYSTGTIYRYLSLENISLRAYRDGKTKQAKIRINKLLVPKLRYQKAV
jgi:hypothetical protein